MQKRLQTTPLLGQNWNNRQTWRNILNLALQPMQKNNLRTNGDIVMIAQQTRLANKQKKCKN